MPDTRGSVATATHVANDRGKATRRRGGRHVVWPLVGITQLLLALAVAGSGVEAADQPPNVLLIVADDLGYGHLGSYGQRAIATPRLDRMALEGTRFTQFYAGSTVCAPSRDTLQTGQHTGHTRIRGNISRSGVRANSLNDEDVTVAEVLGAAGYVTGAIGKWGLGDHDQPGAPWKQGYDFWYGFLDQRHAHAQYPEFLWRNDARVPFDGNAGAEGTVYANDAMTEEALDFIHRHRDERFFLYLAYTIPHAAIAVPEDSLAAYRGRFEEIAYPGDDYPAQPTPRAALAGMITRLDGYVGRLLDELKALGIDDRTITFFTSDNGPADAGGADPEFFDAAGPLRGGKDDLFEGGIRVPMIVRWPGHVPSGRTDPTPWAFWDVLPTLADLAGADTPEHIDGVSVAPTLLGQFQDRSRQILYWEYNSTQALRVGDWKLVKPWGAPSQLYQLAMDEGESRDLALQHPDLVERLEADLEDGREPSADWPLRPPNYWERAVAKGWQYLGILGLVDQR